MSSLEHRLRVMQLQECMAPRAAPPPSKRTKKALRYSFLCWKAYPLCPAWHRKWLLQHRETLMPGMSEVGCVFYAWRLLAREGCNDL